jgi:hypothetical protein
MLGLDVGRFGAWMWLLMLGAVGGGVAVIGASLAWEGGPAGRRWVGLVLGLAVVFRLLLLPSARYVSDDAFRYHWDGKVLAHGINPYRYSPRDPALDSLRTDAPDARINHPQHRTVYPPLAQLHFAAGYLLSPGALWGIQLVTLLAELGGWLLLWGGLRRRGMSPARLLLVAWAPLVVYEGYLPGHVDTLGLPWLTLFVLALDDRRPWLAGGALALACLIKPLPVIFVPVAVHRLGWRGTLRFGAAWLGVVAVAYLPFVGAGAGLVESMWLMARKWSFNGSVAALLEAALPQPTARLAAAGLLAGLLLITPRLGRDLWARLLLAMGAFVVCTPNLYPWYALWMFPLLALRRDPALLALGVLLPLAEAVNIAWRTEQVWAPPLWPSLLIYGVFYPLLALSLWRGWGMFARGSARSV